jgi:CheY-like chemotaxis protein
MSLPQTAPVLIVEDDFDIRETLQQLIECGGYPVLTAANGQDALDLLGSAPRPGLILLDLMMPVMSGYRFLTELRRHPTLADVPVVVVTAAPVQVANVAGILRKPPELEELIRVVEHFCGAQKPAGGAS